MLCRNRCWVFGNTHIRPRKKKQGKQTRQGVYSHAEPNNQKTRKKENRNTVVMTHAQKSEHSNDQTDRHDKTERHAGSEKSCYESYGGDGGVAVRKERAMIGGEEVRWGRDKKEDGGRRVEAPKQARHTVGQQRPRAITVPSRTVSAVRVRHRCIRTARPPDFTCGSGPRISAVSSHPVEDGSGEGDVPRHTWQAGRSPGW